MAIFGLKRILPAWLLAALCACVAAALVRADNFKVDIDAAFPARSDTTAAGFTQWALTGDLSADKRSATHAFTSATGNYTCTVRQTMPAMIDPTIYLNANWLNKSGIAGGYLLSFDGVWVHQKDDSKSIDRPYAGGGAMELSITGLSPGTHTITTYHNNIWGANYGPISRCTITIGGVVVTTVTPSFQVTNDNDCAAAFFTVTAVAGQPLVIGFTPDHTGALDDVILNGFEVDRAAPPGATATTPVPANGNEHVFANNDTPLPGSEGQGSTTLSWTPAASAVSHDVYFGPDLADVTAATRTSPLFRGNQTLTTLAVGSLSSTATYYWRVDEITAAGNTVMGAVWMFRVRHLAFPGAEGYGRFARGGRGGRVIEVTNLLDYDSGAGETVIPGSYRAAIEATGPRTVVFRVAGLIHLKAPCTVGSGNSYLTIAAQTAPGEGICLADTSAGLGSCNDVIMRFLRDRVGDATRAAIDGIGMGSSNDSIIDHCTISWAIDEGTSSRDGHNITFQRNIVSEGLQHSYHYAAADRTKFETHAFAGSISGQIGSYHHNLLAHCTDRNWSLAGGLTQDGKYAGSLDLRNNVVYNWTARTTDGGVKACNFVNNYYKPGPAGGVHWLMRPDAGSATDPQQYYLAGNVLEGYVTESTNWSAGIAYLAGVTEAGVRVNTPFFPDYVTTHNAREAYKLVLSDVGANQPQADVIDTRIVQEVRTGTSHYTGTLATNYPNGITQPPPPNYPGIIDQPTDVKDAVGSPNFPWPAYATSNVLVDTDHDGMPDAWELAIGSNPAVANNNDDPDGDGYTLLENYLNWLAGPHAFTRSDVAIDLDPLPLVAGFTQPTFAVKGATLGSATLQPDGHTVHFVPAAGAKGLGGFSFTATDTDAITLSGTYGICLVPQTHGATTLASSPSGTVNASTGIPITPMTFTVSNPGSVASWRVGGMIPPGLRISAAEGGGSFTGPGILDATTAGTFDGRSDSGGISGTTPLLAGTPTQAGNYTFTLQAFEFGGPSGLGSPVFSFNVIVTGTNLPTVTAQPTSRAVPAGGNTTLSVAATATTGSPTFQWQVNGSDVSGATSATLTLTNVQPANAGLYTAVVTAGAAATSAAAILGVTTASKVTGAGLLLATHSPHPNGNFYDQVLLTGTGEAIVSAPGPVTRTSFIDLTDDIVQVEFSGPGTLSIVLDNASGPAPPVNYTQSTAYMTGHAGIVITGADENTNVLVFTVGRATAFDPTGGFNIVQSITATNNPANNGSPLFQGHTATHYDGVADLAFIAISSTNGKFGGIRTADANYFATKGLTGIYAPGVQFTGPVFIGDISASASATPVVIIGSSPDTRITGGNLYQANSQPVIVSGLTQLKFTPGLDSQGRAVAAQSNRAVLLQNGTDVTNQIVVNPSP